MTVSDELVHDLMARIAALEAEVRVLRQERSAPPPRQDAQAGAGAAPPSVTTGAVDRRQFLRRGLQVAAATAAASALMVQDDGTARADADHTSTEFTETNDLWAIRATGTGTNVAGIRAFADHGEAGGEAVYGNGRIGVSASSNTHGYEAVLAEHVGDYGFGIVGIGAGVGAGVFGRGDDGDGLSGEGKFGLRATSTATGGYGAVISGGKAQVRITPATTVGKPTSGSHLKGELFVDKNCAVYICTVGGSPGTWRKLSTTAA